MRAMRSSLAPLGRTTRRRSRDRGCDCSWSGERRPASAAVSHIVEQVNAGNRHSPAAVAAALWLDPNLPSAKSFADRAQRRERLLATWTLRVSPAQRLQARVPPLSPADLDTRAVKRLPREPQPKILRQPDRQAHQQVGPSRHAGAVYGRLGACQYPDGLVSLQRARGTAGSQREAL